MLVDGVRLFAREAGEHFGGAARGRQEHVTVVQFLERPHEGGQRRRLAGAGIAAHQQQVAGFVLYGEGGQGVEEPCLAGRGLAAQMLRKLLREKPGDAHYARFR